MDQEGGAARPGALGVAGVRSWRCCKLVAAVPVLRQALRVHATVTVEAVEARFERVPHDLNDLVLQLLENPRLAIEVVGKARVRPGVMRAELGCQRDGVPRREVGFAARLERGSQVPCEDDRHSGDGEVTCPAQQPAREGADARRFG